MISKILVVVFAFAGNLLIQWYGNFTGKLPAKGSYLGMTYDSIFVRGLVTQFEYLWVLILINLFFTMMFGIGFTTFKSFLPIAIIWIGLGPISAFIFNTFILKESANYIAIIGLILVIAGGIFVAASKDIAALISK